MKRRRSGAVVWLTVWMVAIVASGGCSPEPQASPLMPQDIVGSWCSETGTVFEFEKSRRFQVRNISMEYYGVLARWDAYNVEWRQGLGGDGVWSTIARQDRQRVRLGYDHVGDLKFDVGEELLVYFLDDEYALLAYDDDPDVGYAEKFSSCSSPG